MLWLTLSLLSAVAVAVVCERCAAAREQRWDDAAGLGEAAFVAECSGKRPA